MLFHQLEKYTPLEHHYLVLAFNILCALLFSMLFNYLFGILYGQILPGYTESSEKLNEKQYPKRDNKDISRSVTLQHNKTHDGQKKESPNDFFNHAQVSRELLIKGGDPSENENQDKSMISDEKTSQEGISLFGLQLKEFLQWLQKQQTEQQELKLQEQEKQQLEQERKELNQERQQLEQEKQQLEQDMCKLDEDRHVFKLECDFQKQWLLRQQWGYQPQWSLPQQRKSIWDPIPNDHKIEPVRFLPGEQ